MTDVTFWRKIAKTLCIGLGIAAAFGACDEQLDSGAACPVLCPVVPGEVRDTSFVAIAMDTSVAGFPGLGLETVLYVASLGDTLQTRGIVRFDALPRTFRHNNSAVDSNIVAVDTGAILRLSLSVPDTLGVETTVEAYDVDLGGAEDSDPTDLGSAFTADRLLGSRTFAPELLKDTIDIPIDPAKLLTRIQTDTPGNRLRVGLRVTSASGFAKLSIVSTNGDESFAPRLIFRPAAGDTSVPLSVLFPSSLTPTDEPVIADALRDYVAVLVAPPDAPPDVLRVGGLPGRRVYLLFDVPSRLIDSTDIVRATLQLTQRPSPLSPQAGDTVGVQQFAVSASANVKDLSRALQLLVVARSDTLRLVPADSGARQLEMFEQVRFWRGTSALKTPRAVALRAVQEGTSAAHVDFFSIEAPEGVRPVLRITYLPRPVAGVP